MIDTVITFKNDGDDDFTVKLPYTMHLNPDDLYDNRKGHEVVRFCIGSLDTTLDIKKELARLYAKMSKEKFALARVLIESGAKQLTMIDCHIRPMKNNLGYFFEFESERFHCQQKNIKRSHSPQT